MEKMVKKILAVTFFFPQENISAVKFEYRFLLDRDVITLFFKLSLVLICTSI